MLFYFSTLWQNKNRGNKVKQNDERGIVAADRSCGGRRSERFDMAKKGVKSVVKLAGSLPGVICAKSHQLRGHVYF
jgi:hypothetical protein